MIRRSFLFSIPGSTVSRHTASCFVFEIQILPALASESRYAALEIPQRMYRRVRVHIFQIATDHETQAVCMLTWLSHHIIATLAAASAGPVIITSIRLIDRSGPPAGDLASSLNRWICPQGMLTVACRWHRRYATLLPTLVSTGGIQSGGSPAPHPGPPKHSGQVSESLRTSLPLYSVIGHAISPFAAGFATTAARNPCATYDLGGRASSKGT